MILCLEGILQLRNAIYVTFYASSLCSFMHIRAIELSRESCILIKCSLDISDILLDTNILLHKLNIQKGRCVAPQTNR